jgi:hypothetical protein
MANNTPMHHPDPLNPTDVLERIARMEVIDDATAAAMRRLSGVERLRMLDAMAESGCAFVRQRVHGQQPTLTELEVARELGRRMSDVTH